MKTTPSPPLAPQLARARRQRLLDKLGGAPILLRAAPEPLRNGDVPHLYRQDSNFHYLTGFDEPESALLALPEGKGKHRTVLFVRPRDPARETWDGPRAGVKGAVKHFGADAAHPVEELWDVLVGELSLSESLAHVLGVDEAFDRELLSRLSGGLRSRRLGMGLPSIIDPRTALHAMRQIKDSDEIDRMQSASDITAVGHVRAMSVARAGMREYEVAAELERCHRLAGSPRDGYEPIVAGGPNACTLHHAPGDRRLRKGELLLIDAGAEHGHYTADVTRTFPVNGRFSEAQREVYKVVLSCQKRCISALRPGLDWRSLNDRAQRMLTKGLVDLGVLKGPVDRLVKKKAAAPWYPHSLGHFLGMDVHDVGPYETPDEKSVKLRAGMVVTIEPGLYFPKNDKTVPKELRGIGVRIEDDVLVTRSGHRVLTAAIPKEIRDIEALTTAQ